MENLLDPGSPRRGSLSSLHRQSSGTSFTHNSKLNSPGSSAGGVNFNNAGGGGNNSTSFLTNGQINPNLYKDLDKFTRYFIIKTVQVIVQSRIGNGYSKNKVVRTECKPTGNDWFNINITDIPEVSDRTKAALDSDSFTVKSNWRVCCEISLRTNDGGRVVLEHWIISNKSTTNQISVGHLLSSTKLPNNQLLSPRSPKNNRSSPVQLSASNIGNSPLSAINSTQQSPTRIRTATFSNTMRTRLNSIDDCSGDTNKYFSVNKNYAGSNNENVDIKESKSCYSLSNSPATNQTSDQTTTTTNTMVTCPSINSLPHNNNATYQTSSNNNNNAATTTTTNTTNATNNTSVCQNQASKPNAVSSIYTIYNRMSLLLKTLMTTTHIVPAYRLASRTSQSDSCIICYRVYNCPISSYQNTRYNSLTNRGSIEDVNYNSNSESPNKRSSSSSSSSYESLNIRDFVGADELEHFCPILKIGSIKTEINELDVSVCYRIDVKNSSQLLKSPRLRDMYNKILDEDCIIAAKQLLAGNDYTKQHHKQIDSSIENHATQCQDALNHLDQPLRPAFAASEPRSENSPPDPTLEIVESAFDGLLQIDISTNDDEHNSDNCNTIKDNTIQSGLDKDKLTTKTQSEPIQVPNVANRAKFTDLSAGSTPKSLTDSFVFVDLNPPFASEDQNDISSFFHGPSPAFSNGFDSLKDVDELTNQLADIEANASQLDEFVDNICMSEDEEEDS